MKLPIEKVIDNPDDERAVIGREYYFLRTSREIIKVRNDDMSRVPKGVLDGKGNPSKQSLNDGNSRMFWMKGEPDGFSFIVEVE